MRIAGIIDHPVLKITVMEMNNRYVLKLEVNLLEQTYKFNEDDHLRSFEDIKKMVDDEFIKECMKRFSEMNKSRGETYLRNIRS